MHPGEGLVTWMGCLPSKARGERMAAGETANLHGDGMGKRPVGTQQNCYFWWSTVTQPLRLFVVRDLPNHALRRIHRHSHSSTSIKQDYYAFVHTPIQRLLLA